MLSGDASVPPCRGREAGHSFRAVRGREGTVRAPCRYCTNRKAMVLLDQAGAGIPSLRLLSAPPGLDRRVEHLWMETFQGAPAHAHAAWRIVPDPCAHLLYHRMSPGDGKGTSHRLLVAGPRSVAVDIDKTRRSVTAGVRLRPWAAPPLFGLSGGELTDGTVALEDLIGAEARTLEGRLRAAPADRVPAILASWLVERATGSETSAERRARAAVSCLCRQASCGETARSVGIGPRRLRALMWDQVGLSPKTVGRIARLHGALRRARAAGSRVSWSRLAAASGYYDQAHMIREFRRLLGETPESWHGRCP